MKKSVEDKNILQPSVAESYNITMGEFSSHKKTVMISNEKATLYGRYDVLPSEGVITDFNGNTETAVSQRGWFFILVPALSLFLLVLLMFTAYSTWKHYRQPVSTHSNAYNFDPAQNYADREPLKSDDHNYKQDSKMQILQESDSELNARTDCVEDTKKDKCSPPIMKPVIITSMCEDDERVELVQLNRTEEMTSERPKTLKFLAASVAFQQSTVPALKRLPYTPDPDCTLYHGQDDSLESISTEIQDKVVPLQLPMRRRMFKPKAGLLERRGSNVALTISLQNSKENNESVDCVSTKSPKPLGYLQKASSPLSPTELHVKACDALQLQQEFWEIPMNHPSEKDFNIAGHGTKNRYRSILPNQHSRVKLPQHPGEDILSTYINANYVRDCTNAPHPNHEENVTTRVVRENAAFIATQGPMANTIADFWRMIWQEKVATVIMITKLQERKEKCTQYLPINVGECVSYDDIRIKVTNLKQCEHFAVRTLEVCHDGGTRIINHYWYTTWMDHETPEKTRGLLELVQEVSFWKQKYHGPIVVHCSAGIGRTGCYIAVTVGCQQLSGTGKVDILKTVSQMRLDRGGMIQTWEQYQFVHQALSRYAHVLAGENVTTPSTTGSIRSPPLLLGTFPGGLPSTNIESIGPQSLKQQKSTFEIKLPSETEVELNLKNSSALSCDNNPLPATSAERTRPAKRKPKLRSVIPLNSPQTQLSDVITSPPEVSVPVSLIKSPFSRLCLQPKDLNAGPSPGRSGRFEWPDAGQRLHPIEKGSSLNETNKNQTKMFNFYAHNSAAASQCQKLECRNSREILFKNRPRSFEFPTNKTASVKNIDDLSSMPRSKERTTPSTDSNEVSSTPSAKANSSHFMFPMPRKS